jgi:hypothetical protein
MKAMHINFWEYINLNHSTPMWETSMWIEAMLSFKPYFIIQNIWGNQIVSKHLPSYNSSSLWLPCWRHYLETVTPSWVKTHDSIMVIRLINDDTCVLFSSWRHWYVRITLASRVLLWWWLFHTATSHWSLEWVFFLVVFIFDVLTSFLTLCYCREHM